MPTCLSSSRCAAEEATSRYIGAAMLSMGARGSCAPVPSPIDTHACCDPFTCALPRAHPPLCPSDTRPLMSTGWHHNCAARHWHCMTRALQPRWRARHLRPAAMPQGRRRRKRSTGGWRACACCTPRMPSNCRSAGGVLLQPIRRFMRWPAALTPGLLSPGCAAARGHEVAQARLAAARMTAVPTWPAASILYAGHNLAAELLPCRRCVTRDATAATRRA